MVKQLYMCSKNIKIMKNYNLELRYATSKLRKSFMNIATKSIQLNTLITFLFS